MGKKTFSKLPLELEKIIEERTAELTKANKKLEEELSTRKMTEQALRENEERYRLLFENINDVIYSVDGQGRIANVSPSIEMFVGYHPDELLGRVFAEVTFLTQESLDLAILDIKYVFSGERISSVEYEFIAKNGEQKFGEVSIAPLFKNKKVVSTISIIRDITERKRLEKEILEISEREKQKLGQDLHDGLGQYLTGIAFMSKKLEQDLTEKNLEESVDAAKITSLMGESITQARNMARGLCPVDLDADSLMDAITQLANHVDDMYNVSCRFRCDEPILIHDNIKAVHLYRVAQEAVHNAIKHGRPENIEISLTGKNGRLQLAIKDDGRGIDLSTGNENGMGLRLMNYRAKMIEATFNIRRNHDGGTVVTCSFTNKTPTWTSERKRLGFLAENPKKRSELAPWWIPTD